MPFLTKKGYALDGMVLSFPNLIGQNPEAHSGGFLRKRRFLVESLGVSSGPCPKIAIYRKTVDFLNVSTKVIFI
jgi:hypothetical protein